MIFDLLLGLFAIVTLVVACAVELRNLKKIAREEGRVRRPILF